MSSHKFVQYLKEYVNSKNISNSIEIKSCTTCNWLYKLGFKYKNIKKDVFINKHKKLDIIQACENFVKVMKELKPYFIKFNEDGTMKNKEYLLDYAIRGAN